MKVVVLQSSYLPWKGHFDLVHDADAFVFYDEVQYTKNDWRNRNRIYSANGLHWLTIPISPRAVKLKISEVRIRDHHWQKKHYNSLRYAYGGAPCFGELADFLADAYLARTWRSLAEVNRYFMVSLARRLGCATEFLDSADFVLEGDRVERLVGLLRQVGASEYVSGPSARAYLEGSEHLFAEHGIALTYKDYSGYPPYPQRREPFEHGVSVLDLVAHVGFERAPWYIWGWREGTDPP